MSFLVTFEDCFIRDIFFIQWRLLCSDTTQDSPVITYFTFTVKTFTEPMEFSLTIDFSLSHLKCIHKRIIFRAKLPSFQLD